MGRGALVFKGDNKPKKKKSKGTKHGSGTTNDRVHTFTSSGVAASTSETQLTPSGESTSSPLPSELSPPHRGAVPSSRSESQTTADSGMPRMQEGTGKITTSGTVVTGHGTRFERELNHGDAIVVVTAEGTEQMRVITMRLSNTSCGLSSALTPQDLKRPTKFSILRKPRPSPVVSSKRNRTGAEGGTAQQQKHRNEEEQAFGTFLAHDKLIYRERTTHGSYRIKSTDIGATTTRSDLLDMRSKKTSDKYC